MEMSLFINDNKKMRLMLKVQENYTRSKNDKND